MNKTGSNAALKSLIMSLCLVASSFSPAIASKVAYRPVAYTLPTGAPTYRTKLEQSSGWTLGGPDGARPGARWVNGAVTFSLATEIERQSAPGLNPEIRYIIEGAQQEKPQAYSSPFSFGTRPDAMYYLGFWSQDTAGHVETISQTEVFLDNTAPRVSMSVDIADTTGAVFIPESLISLTGIDTGVGMRAVEWRFDTEPYQPYSAVISVGSARYGAHTIAYRASDRLGNSTESSLAFVVSPALEISKQRSFAPRTLVWWNYNTNGNEGNVGDGRNPIPSANKESVEAAVRATSIFADTTTTGSAFISAMRSGKYNLFVILGQKENLSPSDAADLAERVNAGDGLISSMTDNIPGPPLANDNGSQARDNVLGVRVSGAYPSADPSVRIAVGPLADSAYTIRAVGSASRIRESLADTLGQYVGTWATGDGQNGQGNDQSDSTLAIVIRQYGSGKAVFLGFDLVAAATDADAETVAGLIRHLMTAVRPETEPAMAGGLVAVEIRVKSLVVPLNLVVSIEELLPNDVTIQAITPQATLSGGAVVWTVVLNANTETAVRYIASLPAVSGVAHTDATISYLVRGTYRPFGAFGLDVVGSSPASYLDAADSVLQSISYRPSTTGGDRAHAEEASRIVSDQIAHPPQMAHDRANAVKDLFKAIKDLTIIEDPNVQPEIKAARSAMDAAVMAYEVQGVN